MTPSVRNPGALSLTDAEVFAAARRALDMQPNVPPEVRVHVEHGHLTLTGSVRWAAERQAAEEIVRGVAGVQAVHNYIVVAHVPNQEGFEPPDR